VRWNLGHLDGKISLILIGQYVNYQTDVLSNNYFIIDSPLSHAAHALNQLIKHLRILLNGRWSVEKLSIAAALRVPLLHKHLG
jgi:hypothetical protein